MNFGWTLQNAGDEIGRKSVPSVIMLSSGKYQSFVNHFFGVKLSLNLHTHELEHFKFSLTNPRHCMFLAKCFARHWNWLTITSQHRKLRKQHIASTRHAFMFCLVICCAECVELIFLKLFLSAIHSFCCSYFSELHKACVLFRFRSTSHSI